MSAPNIDTFRVLRHSDWFENQLFPNSNINNVRGTEASTLPSRHITYYMYANTNLNECVATSKTENSIHELISTYRRPTEHQCVCVWGEGGRSIMYINMCSTFVCSLLASKCREFNC